VSAGVEVIAQILREHRFWSLAQTDCECGWEDLESNALAHVAEAVVAALGLTEETRTLADGMAGQTTNWKTGETTSHSRPCTRQSRLVTPWVGVGEQPQ
jgi:hypothetical protein